MAPTNSWILVVIIRVTWKSNWIYSIMADTCGMPLLMLPNLVGCSWASSKSANLAGCLGDSYQECSQHPQEIQTMLTRKLSSPSWLLNNFNYSYLILHLKCFLNFIPSSLNSMYYMQAHLENYCCRGLWGLRWVVVSAWNPEGFPGTASVAQASLLPLSMSCW